MNSYQSSVRDALLVSALASCCACATTRSASPQASIPAFSIDDLANERNNPGLAVFVGTVVDSASRAPLGCRIDANVRVADERSQLFDGRSGRRCVRRQAPIAYPLTRCLAVLEVTPHYPPVVS